MTLGKSVNLSKPQMSVNPKVNVIAGPKFRVCMTIEMQHRVSVNTAVSASSSFSPSSPSPVIIIVINSVNCSDVIKFSVSSK